MKLINNQSKYKDYVPGSEYGTVEYLIKKYPLIKLYKSTTRKPDGQKFKAGDWVKLDDGSEELIVAFDHYHHPFPISKKDTPIGRFNKGGIYTTVYLEKYLIMTRAIFYSPVNNFFFHDINEYEGVK